MKSQQETQQRVQEIVQQAQAGNADAQYALSILLSQNKEKLNQALIWMDKAIQGGHAGAVYTLGAWYIQGIPLEADWEKGHALLKQASDMGFQDANIMRAALLATGIGVEADWKKAVKIVIKCAQGGYVKAISQIAYLLDMVNDPAAKTEAEKAFFAALEAGDGIALYQRGIEILEPGVTKEIAQKAHHMISLAAKTGHPLAVVHPGINEFEIPETPLPITNVFKTINWGKVSEFLAVPPIPHPLNGDVVAEKPLVMLFKKFLTRRECNYVIASAGPHLHKSQVIDPITGKFVEMDYRSSSDMRFWHAYQDLVIHCINLRIVEVTDEPLSHQEMLGVLRYYPGEQYKAHGDYLTLDSQGKNLELERSGQRIKTFIIYLNEGYLGGETEFCNRNIKVKGSAGDGAFFINIDERGVVDPLSIHASLPIKQGVKWLTTMWIRSREYRFHD